MVESLRFLLHPISGIKLAGGGLVADSRPVQALLQLIWVYGLIKSTVGQITLAMQNTLVLFAEYAILFTTGRALDPPPSPCRTIVFH